MEISFIISVALGVAVVVVMLVMVIVIVYQRWRISYNNAHLKAFLDENVEMHDKIKQYEKQRS